jgi:hypothetical protein
LRTIRVWEEKESKPNPKDQMCKIIGKEFFTSLFAIRERTNAQRKLISRGKKTLSRGY